MHISSLLSNSNRRVTKPAAKYELCIYEWMKNTYKNNNRQSDAKSRKFQRKFLSAIIDEDVREVAAGNEARPKLAG